jgi:hypothetical protein
MFQQAEVHRQTKLTLRLDEVLVRRAEAQAIGGGKLGVNPLDESHYV